MTVIKKRHISLLLLTVNQLTACHMLCRYRWLGVTHYTTFPHFCAFISQQHTPSTTSCYERSASNYIPHTSADETLHSHGQLNEPLRHITSSWNWTIRHYRQPTTDITTCKRQRGWLFKYSMPFRCNSHLSSLIPDLIWDQLLVRIIRISQTQL
jgi:hypothetical protein